MSFTISGIVKKADIELKGVEQAVKDAVAASRAQAKVLMGEIPLEVEERFEEVVDGLEGLAAKLLGKTVVEDGQQAAVYISGHVGNDTWPSASTSVSVEPEPAEEPSPDTVASSEASDTAAEPGGAAAA